MASVRFAKAVALTFAVIAIAMGCSSRKTKKHTPQSLQITTTRLPDATEGVPYTATIEATGGEAPYTWSVTGLPSGLNWSQVGDAAEISGAPASGTAGTYNVNVTVSDSSPQTQSVSATLQLVVNPAGGTVPRADFEANTTQGTAPLTVNFTDKSTGSITQWQWDFDNDGTTDSTDQNPRWTYYDPGWYTVKLTVSDGTNSDTCVKKMYILVANNIWYVNGNGGDDGNGGTDWGDAFATMSKALSVANNYDLILVADAIYSETNLNFNGKKIYLKGVDHNNAGQRPVIDCQGNGRAFYFDSGETEDSVVDNFTIKNGSSDKGGAIYCNSSSPRISNCTFTDSSASSYGGAIYCENSNGLTVTNCVFSNNSAGNLGGAISCVSSNISISNCIFSGNSSDMGGAVLCGSCSPNITNCTFSGNSASKEGGAVYCTFSTPLLNNCILWNNSAGTAGNEIYADAVSSCKLNYCCVDSTGYGGSGTIDDSNNCIHSDPQFVNAAGGDYHLRDTSPCIDAGDNTYVPVGVTTDLDGDQRIVDGNNDGVATVDIGAYEYQP